MGGNGDCSLRAIQGTIDGDVPSEAAVAGLIRDVVEQLGLSKQSWANMCPFSSEFTQDHYITTMTLMLTDALGAFSVITAAGLDMGPVIFAAAHARVIKIIVHSGNDDITGSIAHAHPSADDSSPVRIVQRGHQHYYGTRPQFTDGNIPRQQQIQQQAARQQLDALVAQQQAPQQPDAAAAVQQAAQQQPAAPALTYAQAALQQPPAASRATRLRTGSLVRKSNLHKGADALKREFAFDFGALPEPAMLMLHLYLWRVTCVSDFSSVLFCLSSSAQACCEATDPGRELQGCWDLGASGEGSDLCSEVAAVIVSLRELKLLSPWLLHRNGKPTMHKAGDCETEGRYCCSKCKDARCAYY